MTTRYSKSEGRYKEVSKIIPLASQTFSKSITQYPFGISPLFAQKAKGSRLWDIDGNEYIDFVNALGAILVGYGNEEVDSAVKVQLESGVIFSLAHSLEFEVADRLTRIIPSCEMVRFGKNGSDATAGAVRLARAYTKRDRIATCGYHGWQDWYIGSTTRNAGVPKAVSDLTHKFNYNDIDNLLSLFKSYPDQFAAVIMEPMTNTFPTEGYLEKVKELARQHGALLIFDETITGFRFGLGGAQEYFRVTPDLSTFGKGMSNGFPLSAIVGPERYMRLFQDIFFSFTQGGETLSLAAAGAAIDFMKTNDIKGSLLEQGTYLQSRLTSLIRELDLGDCLSASGHPAWTFLNFSDYGKHSAFAIKTLFLQECFDRGILMLGTHNLSMSHTRDDIDLLVETYTSVFAKIKEGIEKNNLVSMLKVPPLVPLFKVR